MTFPIITVARQRSLNYLVQHIFYIINWFVVTNIWHKFTLILEYPYKHIVNFMSKSRQLEEKKKRVMGVPQPDLLLRSRLWHRLQPQPHLPRAHFSKRPHSRLEEHHHTLLISIGVLILSQQPCLVLPLPLPYAHGLPLDDRVFSL